MNYGIAMAIGIVVGYVVGVGHAIWVFRRRK